ncbi:hypothetical protein AT15_09445 [Kosmotoga arenicorallina S304]|uniref:Lipoprotein signal peptidase n=2 Tax=Kosmotoga arenicorallina TaxID=688066 RepID=A0A176K1N0_9BACT|nr:hypothetical protein AT15_09445 [Kosmotoga arenicorallina S304]
MIVTIGFVITLMIDQITKAVAESNLQYLVRVDLIGRILGLRYVHNKGVSFGLLSKLGVYNIAIITSTIILLLLFIGNRFKDKLTSKEKFIFGIILGGALGNLIDRLRLGYVVDFIELPYWPIFNVADSCIVVGTALLLLLFYRREKLRAGRSNGNES